MEAPDFWDNPERSQKMMKELSTLKEDIQIYQKLETQKEEIELMIEKMMLRLFLKFRTCSMNFRRILKKSV